MLVNSKNEKEGKKPSFIEQNKRGKNEMLCEVNSINATLITQVCAGVATI